VLSERLYGWQQADAAEASYRRTLLSPAAADYLRPGNPRLLDLKRRYAAFQGCATSHALWNEGYVRDEDLSYFRGDNAYVWQLRGRNANILAYALAFYYLKSIDALDLLGRLGEDGAFGNFSFQIGGREVSRDLLDSVAEIYFLERHLEVSKRGPVTVLDIGAGYGRLAQRATAAWPQVGYLCTDAVASSTFLSEFYLRERGVQHARVIPLDEIEAALEVQPVDIAVNIHSFSECQPAAIEWWVALLARHGVRRLMIVPNAADVDHGRVLMNDRTDFTPILEQHGFRLRVAEPKYLDPIVQEYAIFPAQHFLFDLG
jgi:hypothetical protein